MARARVLDVIATAIAGVTTVLVVSDLAQGTGRFNLLQGVAQAALGIAAFLGKSDQGGWPKPPAIRQHFSASLVSLPLDFSAFSLEFVKRERRTPVDRTHTVRELEISLAQRPKSGCKPSASTGWMMIASRIASAVSPPSVAICSSVMISPPPVASTAYGSRRFNGDGSCPGNWHLTLGLVSGAAVQNAHIHGPLARSVLLGIDLGPNLSVTGSLATILWLMRIRREGLNLNAWTFLRIGAVTMPFALACALAASLIATQ